jgi:hypothetical protein
MGCVWLEMYTVLLGERSLNDFEQYRLSPTDELDELDIPDPTVDGASSGFAQTLPNVQKWIERLITYCSMHGSLILGGTENFPGLGISCNKIIEGLHYVEQMLHTHPQHRPDTSSLCHVLGTNKCCEEDIEPYVISDGMNEEGWESPNESHSVLPTTSRLSQIPSFQPFPPRPGDIYDYAAERYQSV